MKTIAYTRFWVLLGPWFALLFSCIAHLKGGVYLPCVLLIALPLCCVYRFFGLTLSLLLLGSAASYTYFEIPLEERLWMVGNALAMALTFIVTTLSCEEAEETLRELQSESKSRLAKLRHLDEKLRTETRKRQMEGKEYEAKLAHLKRKVSS